MAKRPHAWKGVSRQAGTELYRACGVHVQINAAAAHHSGRGRGGEGAPSTRPAARAGVVGSSWWRHLVKATLKRHLFCQTWTRAELEKLAAQMDFWPEEETCLQEGSWFRPTNQCFLGSILHHLDQLRLGNWLEMQVPACHCGSLNQNLGGEAGGRWKAGGSVMPAFPPAPRVARCTRRSVNGHPTQNKPLPATVPPSGKDAQLK